MGSEADSVRIDFQNAEGNLDLELYDSTGTMLLDASTGSGDGEWVSLDGLADDTYLIRVFGQGGATNLDYTLTVNAPRTVATTWTVLVYLDGDDVGGGNSSPETYALQKINELESVRLPSNIRVGVLLDRISDIEEQEDGAYVNKERQQLEGALEKIFSRKLEAYYGMILMDGDSMGKWLAADEIAPILGNRFHPKVRAELKEIEPLGDYLDAQRPASPAWHQAISAGLNNFSVSLARLLVEEVFMGKLIYAGGDDLLAMVAMHDLPGLMLALRCAYSGIMPWDGKDTERAWKWLTGNTMPGNIHLAFSGGYGFMKHGKQKRLFRLMGGKATASMGAVVAHHKTPLARVLAVLRDAERAAKNIDGKDAFALALMKRSGGESLLLGNWMLNGTLRTGDMGLLLRLRDLLARPELSRRAAYILIEVIKEVPADGDALAAVIRHQLFRQGISRDPEAQEEVETLARELAARAMVNRAASDEKKKQLVRSGWHSAGAWLRDLLITAEFLAREGRVPTPVETKEVRHG